MKHEFKVRDHLEWNSERRLQGTVKCDHLTMLKGSALKELSKNKPSSDKRR